MYSISRTAPVYADLPSIEELKLGLRIDQFDDTLEDAVRVLRSRAQSELLNSMGYLIGSSTYTIEFSARRGAMARLPISPISALTSVEVGTRGAVLDTDSFAGDYSVEQNEEYGIWTLNIVTAGTYKVIATVTATAIPGDIANAVESYIYDRMNNEPPYTINFLTELAGSPVKQWVF